MTQPTNTNLIYQQTYTKEVRLKPIMAFKHIGRP
jgi:hypothetical protein